MAEIGRDPQAVQFYEQVRREVAENRAVDAAESVVAACWLAELSQMRRAALGLLASAGVAEHDARERLRRAQDGGGGPEFVRARVGIEALQAEHAESLEKPRLLLARVDVELDRMVQIGDERRRCAEHDIERLRAAWTGAYGGPAVGSAG
jgi:hypothetical protein